jgi:hypothetical protein
MPTRHVNERQRDILRWIADGCPDRDWPDETHKHSARALATRGLVRVSRSGGRWTAVLTDDGEHFHQHGEYPEGHRFGPKPPEPEPPVTPVAELEKPRKRGRPAAAAQEPVNEWAIDSPERLKQRAKGASEGTPAHPWDSKVLISVKEAAWLLSVSEGMIREAARAGDVDRVFIGAGTTNYRVVHDSLLAWVNTMPTEPVRPRW